MRFISKGPDVPEQLIQDHEDGNVVFFCGAGVSFAAGFKDYKWLTNAVYDDIGVSKSATAQVEISRGRYDLALGILELEIHSRERVRQSVWKLLTLGRQPKASEIQLHQSLLTLAKEPSGHTRIVTTNFDRLFLAGSENPPFYVAPTLPVARRSHWNGIVHLHGLLPPSLDDTEKLNNLVLSSGDFGLAYLVDRWASRFVSELFREYVVCFIGYSIGDPVLRYMLDAMSADMLRGEHSRKPYAFAGYGRDPEKERELWFAKGVTPIPYSQAQKHKALSDTMARWAGLYRDGLGGKRAVVELEAGPPSQVADDGQVGRMIWALTDPSGKPAEAFAQMEPAPPIGWLSVLTEKRLIPGLLSTDDLRNPRLFQLARWMVRHLAEPDLMLWVAANGGICHSIFRDLAVRKLQNSNLPEPVERIWRLICSGATDTKSDFTDMQMAEGVVNGGVWDSALTQIVSRLYIPRVQLHSAAAWKDFRRKINKAWGVEESGDQPSIRDFVDFSIVLRENASRCRQLLNRIKQSQQWDEAAVDLLPEFTGCLQNAMAIITYLDKGTKLRTLTHIDRKCIAESEANHNFEDWSVLVDACRDAFIKVEMFDRKRAIAEYTRWSGIRYPLFRRLCIYFGYAVQSIPAELVLNDVLSDQGFWLWTAEAECEVLRLLSVLPKRLTRRQQDRLLGAILDGPPKELFLSNPGPEILNRVREEMILTRLIYYSKSAALADTKIKEALQELKEKYPEISAEGKEEPIVGVTATGGGFPGTINHLPHDAKALANALDGRSYEANFLERDDWQELCKSKTGTAIESLKILAKTKRWPARAWGEAFYIFADKTIAQASWEGLHEILLEAHDAFLMEVSDAISWWMEELVEVIQDSGGEEWLLLLDRLLKINEFTTLDKDGEILTSALNQTVGRLAKGLINYWYLSNPKKDAGIIPAVRDRLESVLSKDPNRWPAARLVIASHLEQLYVVDPLWVRERLLHKFDWTSHNAETPFLWRAYLTFPRTNDGLAKEMLPMIFDAAHHYSQLGNEMEGYTTLLTSIAVFLGAPFKSRRFAEQYRQAFEALPADGIGDAARELCRIFDSTEKKVEFWMNRGGPVIDRVWPKQANKRSEKEANAFAWICFKSGGVFGEVYKSLEPLMQQPHQMFHVKEFAGSVAPHKFPLESVKFMDKLTATLSVDVQVYSKDIKTVLDRAIETKPDLKDSQEMRRVRERIG